jgi:RimJ/RimL family protein N-acetyltransferase
MDLLMTIEILELTPADIESLLDDGSRIGRYAVADGALPPDFLLSRALDARGSAAYGWLAPRLVVSATDDLVVGSVGFKGPPAAGSVEVGYGIAPHVRGRGVATEAVRLLVERAMKAGVDRVCILTAVDNLASRRVAEKAGFTHQGRRDSGDDGVVDVWVLEKRDP